jgi:hypothetical protein
MTSQKIIDLTRFSFARQLLKSAFDASWGLLTFPPENGQAESGWNPDDNRENRKNRLFGMPTIWAAMGVVQK